MKFNTYWDIPIHFFIFFVYQPEFDSLHRWFINRKTTVLISIEMSNNSMLSLTTGGWKKNSLRLADGFHFTQT